MDSFNQFGHQNYWFLETLTSRRLKEQLHANMPDPDNMDEIHLALRHHFKTFKSIEWISHVYDRVNILKRMFRE